MRLIRVHLVRSRLFNKHVKHVVNRIQRSAPRQPVCRVTISLGCESLLASEPVISGSQIAGVRVIKWRSEEIKSQLS